MAKECDESFTFKFLLEYPSFTIHLQHPHYLPFPTLIRAEEIHFIPHWQVKFHNSFSILAEVGLNTEHWTIITRKWYEIKWMGANFNNTFECRKSSGNWKMNWIRRRTVMKGNNLWSTSNSVKVWIGGVRKRIILLFTFTRWIEGTNRLLLLHHHPSSNGMWTTRKYCSPDPCFGVLNDINIGFMSKHFKTSFPGALFSLSSSSSSGLVHSWGNLGFI